MKEIDELNQRMDSNDEIVNNLVKKNTEMEKQLAKITDNPVPDYSVALDTIITEVRGIKQANKRDVELTLLQQINEKLIKVPTSATKQLRVLLFPETNQGQYYKIVFGRLIPWGICFVVATYIFLIVFKTIGIYKYNEKVNECKHYEDAWHYLRKRAGKKTIINMDDAYQKTEKK